MDYKTRGKDWARRYSYWMFKTIPEYEQYCLKNRRKDK